MSEVVLDRVRLDADGSVSVTVLVRLSDGARRPGAVTFRLRVRDGDEALTVPGVLTDEGAGTWSATGAVSPDALGGVGAEVVILDCVVDVVTDGVVMSRRLGWSGGGTRWLPYPTARGNLTLGRVTS